MSKNIFSGTPPPIINTSSRTHSGATLEPITNTHKNLFGRNVAERVVPPVRIVLVHRMHNNGFQRMVSIRFWLARAGGGGGDGGCGGRRFAIALRLLFGRRPDDAGARRCYAKRCIDVQEIVFHECIDVKVVSFGYAEVVLFERLFQPAAQVLAPERVEQLALGQLIVERGALRFRVVAVDVARNAQVRQLLDQIGVAREEYLLGETGYFVVDRFAGQRVDHLDGALAVRPVDAKVGRLDLVARFGRGDQREFWLVQRVRRRQPLHGVLDAAAYGTVRGESARFDGFSRKTRQINARSSEWGILTGTCAPGAEGCLAQSSTSTPAG